MMMLLSTHRRAAFLAVCLALLSVLAGSSLVAQSQGRHSPQPQLSVAPKAGQIDWTHPVRVQAMSTRSGSATALLPNTVPLYMPLKAGKAFQPEANFPSNCFDASAYYVTVQGQNLWTHKVGNYETETRYMWCPRWSGDTVGENWSFGYAIVISGCSSIQIGTHNSSYVLGAYIAPPVVDDGEGTTVYSGICNGAAVWDDSQTVNGSGKYSVTMQADFLATQVILASSSPCCY